MRRCYFLVLLTAVALNAAAQCKVPGTDREGPYVTVTGILGEESYPCFDEGEECPPCITLVLRTRGKTYFLTGKDIVVPDTGDDVIKLDITGIAGNNGHYDWLQTEEWSISAAPVTTNIFTEGYVTTYDYSTDSRTPLAGIEVIVHSKDFTTSDTVYSEPDGRFRSLMRDILYPVDTMHVIAIDTTEQYFAATGTVDHYTYECGVGFNPETDIAYNMEPLTITMEKIVAMDLSDTAGRQGTPTKRLTPDGLLLLPDGRRITLLGTDVR